MTILIFVACDVRFDIEFVCFPPFNAIEIHHRSHTDVLLELIRFCFFMFLPYFVYLFIFCERNCIEVNMDFAVYASSAVGREQWNNNALRAVVSRRLSVCTHKQTYSGVDKAPSTQFNALLNVVSMTRARFTNSKLKFRLELCSALH